MTKTIASLLAGLLLSGAVGAQGSPRDAILVTPAWLAEHLHDANIVILHVGDPQKYAESHIPGARLVRLADISVSDRSGMTVPAGMTPPPPPPLEGPKNGLTLEMPTAEQLHSQFEKFGISDNSKIVVYQAQDFVTPSTRVVFTLDYAGLGKNTVVLDGGLAAWTADKREATSVVPEPKTGKLSPLKLRPIVASAEFVRDHIGKPGFTIIDAREPVTYDGIPPSRGTPPKRLGHVAGAKSLFYENAYESSGQLKSAATLADLFKQAGVQKGDTIVGYCYIGQYATAMLFAARSLGYPVMLYDGSWNDWDKRSNDFPVEKKP